MGNETLPATVHKAEVMLPAAPPSGGEPTSPMALLTLAVKQNLDIDKLERIAALYERAEAGRARQAFFTALAAFQSEVPPLVKDSAVDFTTGRGRTHYRHASLPKIAEAIREPLKRNGLAYRFTINSEPERVTVTCIVTHIDGHSEPTSMSAPADDSGSKNAIQSLGSTVTYLQRYTLVGSLGLTTTDEDTDGRPTMTGPARYEDQQQATPPVPEDWPRPPAQAPAHEPPAEDGALPDHMRGTPDTPLMGADLAKGVVFGGPVTERDDNGWIRIKHITAGIALSKPKGSTVQFPKAVAPGAYVVLRSGFTGKSKTSQKPFVFAELVAIKAAEAENESAPDSPNGAAPAAGSSPEGEGARQSPAAASSPPQAAAPSPPPPGPPEWEQRHVKIRELFGAFKDNPKLTVMAFDKAVRSVVRSGRWEAHRDVAVLDKIIAALVERHAASKFDGESE